MSTQTMLVGAGQILVGWSMAVPGFMANGAGVDWLKGWRAHLVILAGSGFVGLASLVVGTWLGLSKPLPPLPASCDAAAPHRCCHGRAFPSYCFHPSTWAGQRLSARGGGR